MKTRRNLVSNSSSTSFIMAVQKDQNKCKTCGRSDPCITKMIEDTEDYSDDTSIHGYGYEAVMHNLECNDWRNEDYQKELISKVKEYESKKDWLVFQCGVSYHADHINKTIEEMEKAGTLVVLDRCG
jgi:hypothetical protein